MIRLLESRIMERRQHTRLIQAGRRQTDRRPPAADNRRVLLAGPDEGWRLLTAYFFEEAGYAVYAAADHDQAVTFTARLLPDAVIVHEDVPAIAGLLARLADAPSAHDIQVVVLTSALESADAHDARAAGAITMMVQPSNVDLLVDEVDSLTVAIPRVQRSLKRRLLDLQELARYYTPDADGQANLRGLIDRLQVAIFAVDQDGHCIAASDGATALTGYTRGQLLATSVFQPEFAGGRMSDTRWQIFLANRHYSGTTTITNHAGESVTVHAAAVAAILPGFHLAAFAVA
jgi:PAS domain S-box-containing protein